MTERTPEQRARDGRLAWLIVGACGVVTLMLVGFGLHLASGRIARLGTAPAMASLPPAVATVPAATDPRRPSVRPPARGPRPALRPPPAPDAPGMVQKRRGERENEATKQSGGGDREDEVGRGGGDRDDGGDEDTDTPLRT